jgi:hypothetical protein
MIPQQKLSLDQIMDQSQKMRMEFNSSDSPYKATINNILFQFDDFAANYKILWQELSNKILQGTNNSLSAPVDDRITELWLSLQEIVSQYKDPRLRAKVEEGMKFLETLQKSNPDLLPGNESYPDILVFVKQPDGRNIARRYPYTNVFFIGINALFADPANSAETDWKPIAHELGHYIYWNSCFKTKAQPNFAEADRDPVFAQDIEYTLQTAEKFSSFDELKKRALTSLMIAWSEEMFADLVGTSLLRKDYAVSAQNLFLRQLENPKAPRFTDDIDHPIPYLRPYVCAEALKLVQNKQESTWSNFIGTIANSAKMNSFDSQTIFVGLFTTDDEQASGFEEVPLKIDTIQDAITLVIPVLYRLLQTKEAPRKGRAGIELIKSRIQDAFADIYIDVTDELEKGDGPGFRRRVRKGAKWLIGRILKRFNQ